MDLVKLITKANGGRSKEATSEWAAAFLARPVLAIRDDLEGLPLWALKTAREAELAAKARKGVIDAIGVEEKVRANVKAEATEAAVKEADEQALKEAEEASKEEAAKLSGLEEEVRHLSAALQELTQKYLAQKANLQAGLKEAKAELRAAGGRRQSGDRFPAESEVKPAWAVSCKHCGAKASEPCKSANGRPDRRWNHRARNDAWNKKQSKSNGKNTTAKAAK